MSDDIYDKIEGIFYTDERAKTMLFSDLPMGEEKE